MTAQDSPRALSGHTPTPWTAWKQEIHGPTDVLVCFAGMNSVASAVGVYMVGEAEAKANAEYIVRAVNSHQALVEALSDVLAWIDEVGAEAKRRDTERLAPARALALAEGSQP